MQYFVSLFLCFSCDNAETRTILMDLCSTVFHCFSCSDAETRSVLMTLCNTLFHCFFVSVLTMQRQELYLWTSASAESMFLYYFVGTLALVFLITIFITRALRRRQVIVSYFFTVFTLNIEMYAISSLTPYHTYTKI